MTGFDDTDRRQLALVLYEYAEHVLDEVAILRVRTKYGHVYLKMFRTELGQGTRGRGAQTFGEAFGGLGVVDVFAQGFQRGSLIGIGAKLGDQGLGGVGEPVGNLDRVTTRAFPPAQYHLQLQMPAAYLYDAECGGEEFRVSGADERGQPLPWEVPAVLGEEFGAQCRGEREAGAVGVRSSRDALDDVVEQAAVGVDLVDEPGVHLRVVQCREGGHRVGGQAGVAGGEGEFTARGAGDQFRQAGGAPSAVHDDVVRGPVVHVRCQRVHGPIGGGVGKRDERPAAHVQAWWLGMAGCVRRGGPRGGGDGVRGRLTDPFVHQFGHGASESVQQFGHRAPCRRVGSQSGADDFGEADVESLPYGPGRKGVDFVRECRHGLGRAGMGEQVFADRAAVRATLHQDLQHLRRDALRREFAEYRDGWRGDGGPQELVGARVGPTQRDQQFRWAVRAFRQCLGRVRPEGCLLVRRQEGGRVDVGAPDETVRGFGVGVRVAQFLDETYRALGFDHRGPQHVDTRADGRFEQFPDVGKQTHPRGVEHPTQRVFTTVRTQGRQRAKQFGPAQPDLRFRQQMGGHVGKRTHRGRGEGGTGVAVDQPSAHRGPQVPPLRPRVRTGQHLSVIALGPRPPLEYGECEPRIPGGGEPIAQTRDTVEGLLVVYEDLEARRPVGGDDRVHQAERRNTARRQPEEPLGLTIEGGAEIVRTPDSHEQFDGRPGPDPVFRRTVRHAWPP
ncbi:hypothetical protein [Embleya sp. AB8]|uniref:hypothetical protein n=1 Tax=Embleya sp. AB8 TaxID=3156304 RepID=UPI003C728292